MLSAGSKNELTFPFVSDEDSIETNDLVAAMKLGNVLLSSDADSLAFEVEVYGQDAGNLRSDPSKSLDLAFEVLSVETGQPLASIKLPQLNNRGTTRQAARLVFPVQALRGKQVHLAPTVSNVDLAKVNGALVHVYEVVEDGSQKAQAEIPSLVATAVAGSFSVWAYPNPFNPSTQIRFVMKKEGEAVLRVYNLQGQMIRELLRERRSAGEHISVWDGRDANGSEAASGVYFVRFETGGEMKVGKITLIR